MLTVKTTNCAFKLENSNVYIVELSKTKVAFAFMS